MLYYFCMLIVVSFNFSVGEHRICSRKSLFNPKVYWSGKEGGPQVNVHPCGVHFAAHLGDHQILPFVGLSPRESTTTKMAVATSCKSFLRFQFTWTNAVSCFQSTSFCCICIGQYCCYADQKPFWFVHKEGKNVLLFSLIQNRSLLYFKMITLLSI